MWQILRRNPQAFGAALLLHLILAVLTLVGMDWSATFDEVRTKPRVVQATIVSTEAVEAQVAARRQAAAKRKIEEKARQRAEAERKAAEAAQRRAKEEARRVREADLLAALEAEQAAAGELSVYTNAIRERIRRHWVRQPSMGRDLSCLVEVRLILGGDVVPAGVRVIRSSGNPAFDRSVVTAVYKASPLPVPSGQLFGQFRNLRLNFKL